MYPGVSPLLHSQLIVITLPMQPIKIPPLWKYLVVLSWHQIRCYWTQVTPRFLRHQKFPCYCFLAKPDITPNTFPHSLLTNHHNASPVICSNPTLLHATQCFAFWHSSASPGYPICQCIHSKNATQSKVAMLSRKQNPFSQICWIPLKSYLLFAGVTSFKTYLLPLCDKLRRRYCLKGGPDHWGFAGLSVPILKAMI